MLADTDSNIAWHRVQLKKNREALKALEVARFRSGEFNGAAGQAPHRLIATLRRKIAESVRCVAAYERQTRRPVATDLHSLATVSWGAWNANLPTRPVSSRA
jgi:hypothetical protein